MAAKDVTLAQVVLPTNFLVKVNFNGRLPDHRPELGRCWEWVAGKFTAGYGTFWFEGRAQVAHGISYRLLVGHIPATFTLDHLCRVRHCVNPKHLEPVTSKENILRGTGLTAANARKDKCRYGHPYDEENTYVRVGTHASRECRICHRRWDAEYRARRKTMTNGAKSKGGD